MIIAEHTFALAEKIPAMSDFGLFRVECGWRHLGLLR